MEIFKDDKIFSYIDKHALLVNENNAECILKLVGVGEWGENEYTNFINEYNKKKENEKKEKVLLNKEKRKKQLELDKTNEKNKINNVKNQEKEMPAKIQN